MFFVQLGSHQSNSVPYLFLQKISKANLSKVKGIIFVINFKFFRPFTGRHLADNRAPKLIFFKPPAYLLAKLNLKLAAFESHREVP